VARSKLISTDPSPEELERLISALPRPPEEAVAQFRQSLERSAQDSAPPLASEWPPILQEAEAKTDVRYAGPPTSDRPLVGSALVFAKRVFRLVGQPFINEALRKQVEFNQTLLAGVGQVYEMLQQYIRSQALWRTELEARLERLERAVNAQAAPPPEPERPSKLADARPDPIIAEPPPAPEPRRKSPTRPRKRR
jgi:hypothetical protein